MARSVLRAKGQITLPVEVRRVLHIDEGDGVSFEIIDDGVVLRGLKSIRADQAWFWTPEWQAKEREAEEDIAAGRGTRFLSTEEFIEHVELLD